MRIQIPVAQLEVDEGGNTLWVHNDKGITVLRIKLTGGAKFQANTTCINPASHVDIMALPNDVEICLADDAK